MLRQLAVIAFATVAQVFVPGAKVEDPGATAVPTSQWTWRFGDIVSGLKYESKLTVENRCPAPQTVSVFIYGSQEIQLPAIGCAGYATPKTCSVTLPPGSTDIAALFESDVDWYYVDPLARAITPRPFRKVSGEIVLYHPANGDCPERRESYTLGANLFAQRGDPPPPPPEPERFAGAGFCDVWWNTGQKPPQLPPDEDCRDEIRPLAISYVERVLARHATAFPDDWSWLPSREQIAGMSAAEMVALKQRAERQLEGRQ